MNNKISLEVSKSIENLLCNIETLNSIDRSSIFDIRVEVSLSNWHKYISCHNMRFINIKTHTNERKNTFIVHTSH